MNSRQNNFNFLLAARDCVHVYGSCEIADWFNEAMDLFISGEADSLDEAFGIRGYQGQPKIISPYYITKRDQYLREAACNCLNQKPTQKARELKDEILKFSVIWPDLVNMDKPRPGWSKLKQALFKAFKASEKTRHGIPTSQKQLFNIIKMGSVRDDVVLDVLKMRWTKGAFS